MRRPAIVTIGILLLTAPATADAAPHERTCDGVPCFRLKVPLDRSGTVPGRVSLLVHRRPALRGPRRGLTFLLAGGPGQSATSAATDPFEAPEQRYLTWARLTPRNDVVVFDQRGTGGSGLLRCRDLQASNPIDAGRAAEGCAAVLSRRRAFYRTADSVEDLEAVRQALGAPRVTLIGVSYGTLVAQRYAIAHPDRVERMVLDSVVDPDGLDPFARDSFAAARRIVGDLCRPRCGFTRDPVADTSALVARMAANPLQGSVVLPSGRVVSDSMSSQELFFALGSGDVTPFLRLGYPGAVAAALRGDPAALLRLKRRAIGEESFGPVRDHSAAVYASTLCEEVSFPWERGAAFPERPPPTFEAARAVESAFAPFNALTAAGNHLIRLCRRWPAASAQAPAPPPPPDVPVLVLSGGQDMRTPLEVAQRVAGRYPRASLLAASALGHSLLGAGDECVDSALVRFLRGDPVPRHCLRVDPIAPPPPPPTSVQALRPLRGTPGLRGRALRAVELTAVDMTEEFAFQLFAGNVDPLGALGGPRRIRGAGLRGGHFDVNVLPLPKWRLHRLELVPGVRVSGRIRGVDRRARVLLRVSGPATPDGVLRITNGDRVRGRLGGRAVRGRFLAEPRGLELLISQSQARPL